MADSGGHTMDSILKSLGGCGRFQVLVVVIVFTAEFTSPFSLMFMTFGNYNPGWRCLDNTSALATSSPSLLAAFANNNNTALGVTEVKAKPKAKVNQSTMASSSEADGGDLYVKDQCPDFEACRRVEFNPESLTIVSQWHLICHRSWIVTIIISTQMTGVMIGAYMGGYLGDKIGRKRTICINTAINGLLNLVAAFSVSWHMFVVLRFFIGATYASMIGFPFVYSSELTPRKWRSFLASLPAWNVGASLFAVVAMLTKDWRYIHLATAAITLFFFLPLLWIPESLRWLTIKGQTKKAVKVANQIADLNRKPAPDKGMFIQLASHSQSEDGKGHKYSWYDLWRKDVRWYTLIFGFIWITMAIIYYTSSFGIKNLAGNFYVNLIVMFFTEIPVSIISTIAPNMLGRKWATFSFFCVATVCQICIVFLDQFGDDSYKGTTIFVFVLVSRFSIVGAWFVLYTLTFEIYPTVIRSTGLGFGSCMSRIGGIIAPYLIPNNSSSSFVSLVVMACLISICSVLLLFLPETKGKALIETWKDEDLTATHDASLPEEKEGTEMLKKSEGV